MGTKVYANCNEIACKAGDDKVVASFPDVCLSPPSPPAGPVPIPYPNTSFSKDMKKGSKTVKIKKKEVMLKDKSFYKTSPLGDEAATKSFGSGVISHQITGKTYFSAWSMDVKFEGKNVDRHLDFTTSNHASQPGNEQIPLPGLEGMITPPVDEDKLCPCCKEPLHENQKDSKGNRLPTMKQSDFYAAAQPPIPVPAGVTVPQMSLSGMGPPTAYEAAKMLGCKNLPDPPDSGCGIYFKPEKGLGVSKGKRKSKRIDKEWKNQRPIYVESYNQRQDANGTPHKKIQPGDSICHKTAKAGGGCLGDSDGKNLIPKKELTPDCQKLDDALGQNQRDSHKALSR